jgi:hypothetical protein
MAQVIIRPAGGPIPRKHYRETVETPVPETRLRRFLDPVDFSILQQIYGTAAVPTWGLTPSEGTTDRAEWHVIHPQDIVLFTGGNQAYAVGSITHKTHNRNLALDLWQVDKKRRTWEFVYFVNNMRRVSVPYTKLNKALGNKANNVFQRTLVLDPQRSEAVIATLSLEDLAGVLDGEDQLEIHQTPPKTLPPGPLPRPKKVSGKGGEYYSRDPGFASQALVTAMYQCEIDRNHKTFRLRATGNPYMETHHLVPMQVQKAFKNRIDVPENIVSLCPTCHRLLHSAVDDERKRHLETLYLARQVSLRIRGIEADLNPLLKYYGVR